MGIWDKFPRDEFPNLAYGRYKNHRQTSFRTRRYNCIAWAADDTENWWWPGGDDYWPAAAPNEETPGAFIRAFELLGYAPCNDGAPEVGFEKVAIYVTPRDGKPQHAARQLRNGKWTSKLGRFKDITHDTLLVVSSPYYGRAQYYLKRKRRPPTTARIRFLTLRFFRILRRETIGIAKAIMHRV